MATNAPWTRTLWADAALLAEQVDPDNIPADAAGRPPQDWFARLVSEGRYLEAVPFLAHALPRYEAVVWGAQALLEMGAAERMDPIMVAVLRWIDQPADALRREAGDLAEGTRRNTAARFLGLAVMMSGGSLAPANLAPVNPPPGVCATMVSGAVLTGAYTLRDPAGALRAALARGEMLARGG